MGSIPVDLSLKARKKNIVKHWSPDLEKSIYRNWGIYFNLKQKPDIALPYLNKAIENNPKDVIALYSRGFCNRNVANPKAILIDCEKAIALREKSFSLQLQKCDALLDSNQFESCKQNLHQNIRRLSNYANLPFPNRLGAVDSIFTDCLGSNYGHFLYENRKIVPEAIKYFHDKTFTDDRPLWKILKEDDMCDTTSVFEKYEELLHPREAARRERANRIINQLYLNRSWKDVIFFKELRKNPNFYLQNVSGTAPTLNKLLCDKYGEVKTYLRMLHARSPLYNETKIRFPNKELKKKHQESFIYRIQYQTRRNMISILRVVKLLRAKGSVKRLTKFIEETLGDYVILKTNNVMPWKFEFINDVLNNLALTHVDLLIHPRNFRRNLNSSDSLLKILNISIKQLHDVRTLKYGSKKPYIKEKEQEFRNLNLRNFILRLEKRLVFAEYAIEKAYLHFEIARSHFELNNFAGCLINTRCAFDEATSINHNVWCFLSLIQTLKVNHFLHRLNVTAKILSKLEICAEKIAHPKLVEWVNMCQLINNQEIEERSKKGSSLIRKKSKVSVYSRVSYETIKSDISSNITSDVNLIKRRTEDMWNEYLSRN